MATSKICPLKVLLKKIKEARSLNKRIVFTNGCFDILHVGHIKIFREAKKYGDILVVGVNSDKSIKKIKTDKRPIIEEKYRLKVLEAISYIDYITLFDEDTPKKLIEKIKPDILIKGGDWKINKIVGRDIVESYGGKIKRVKLIEGISTTNIINKILKVYGKN